MTTALAVLPVADTKLLPRRLLRSLGVPFTEPIHRGGCFIPLECSVDGDKKITLVELSRYGRLLASFPPVTKGLNKRRNGSFSLFYQPERITQSPKCSKDLLARIADSGEAEARYFAACKWSTHNTTKELHPINYSPGKEIREDYPELCDVDLLQERLDRAGIKYRATQKMADEQLRRERGGNSTRVIHGQEHSREWVGMFLFEGGRIQRAVKVYGTENPTQIVFDEPAFPYPPPVPIENAEHYYGMPRPIEKIDSAEQKALFREWNLKIGWMQSDSIEKLDSDPRCPVCGESLFTEDAVCTGCGEVFWELRKHKKESEEDESSHSEEERTDPDNIYVGEHVTEIPRGRKKMRQTPEEFLLGLLASHSQGLSYYITHPKMWAKTVSAFEILCGHKLPRDVSEETGESQRTIESRCERIAAALRKIAGSIRHPIIHDMERAALLELLGIPVNWETPSTPEPRRVQPLPRPHLPKDLNSFVLTNAGTKTY